MTHYSISALEYEVMLAGLRRSKANLSYRSSHTEYYTVDGPVRMFHERHRFTGIDNTNNMAALARDTAEDGSVVCGIVGPGYDSGATTALWNSGLTREALATIIAEAPAGIERPGFALAPPEAPFDGLEFLAEQVYSSWRRSTGIWDSIWDEYSPVGAEYWGEIEHQDIFIAFPSVPSGYSSATLRVHEASDQATGLPGRIQYVEASFSSASNISEIPWSDPPISIHFPTAVARNGHHDFVVPMPTAGSPVTYRIGMTEAGARQFVQSQACANPPMLRLG